MPTLTIQIGPGAATSFSFETAIVIGRSSQQADMALDDPSISRRHALLQPVATGWQLVDLDSANGTLLNGRPVSQPTPMRSGDLVTVGTVLLRYDEVAAADVEHDLRLARRVQQHLLPRRPPELDGVVFAIDYRPAQAVGGDFYDFLWLTPTRLAIATGDVSGKGIAAALFAAKVVSELRFESAGQTEPGAILDRLNRALLSMGPGGPEGMFSTLVLGVLDVTAASLRVASAGHPLAVLRTSGGEARWLGRTGAMPLGVRVPAAFSETDHLLTAGDAVLFYTDGITEAVGARGELFGTERLFEAVQQSGGSAKEITRSVLAAVQRFGGGQAIRDDVTLVCFTYKGVKGSRDQGKGRRPRRLPLPLIPPLTP